MNLGIKLTLAALPERIFEIAKAMEYGTLTQGKDRKNPWTLQTVPPWSKDAVRFFLHDNSIVADSDKACDAILYASCGFGRLIQSLCDGNLTLEKALELPKYAELKIAPDIDTFYEKIGMPRHIDSDYRKRMENFLGHVNGEKRDSASIEEYRLSFNLKPSDVIFLCAMGLLQEGDENTWIVPKLYLRLIS
jgi:hypothetical protein